VAGSELLSLSISEARRRIRAREISPVELTHSYLQQIDRLNARLNVYLTVTEKAALAAAKAAEDSVVRGDLLGSLHGIPVALKDNFEVAGVRTTAGSKFLRDNISGEDCEVAYRLRQAGAIILGKLHMHEWAIGGTTRNPHYGPGRNPWDPMRSPGGSSGGSGAAIAADMALAAMGTDTGGSVRIPAALNGVTALRPTSGRISKRGVVTVSDTFDTAGPLARRVEDVALVLQALAGYDPDDPTSFDVRVDDYVAGLRKGVRGLRIGLLGGYFRTEPWPEVSDLVIKAGRAFEALRAVVEEVELPGAEDAIERTSEMILAEAAAFHWTRLQERPEDFGTDVLTRLRLGADVSGARYARARAEQRRWRRYVVGEVLGRYDILVAPTCGIPAPVIEESDGVETTRLLTRFTYPFSLARVPVVSIPCGFAGDTLPVGMQLVGRPWDEALILRAAWAYQESTDWHLRRPPTI
jgi:aspartyl-tRNA(Asn)/glutamyl-tRNA(Gln) amidotransferase subunit A